MGTTEVQGASGKGSGRVTFKEDTVYGQGMPSRMTVTGFGGSGYSGYSHWSATDVELEEPSSMGPVRKIPTYPPHSSNPVAPPQFAQMSVLANKEPLTSSSRHLGGGYSSKFATVNEPRLPGELADRQMLPLGYMYSTKNRQPLDYVQESGYHPVQCGRLDS